MGKMNNKIEGKMFILLVADEKIKKQTNQKVRLFFWRRRRDSNPRTAFDGYTISNRARSTKLRDFSVFALANLVAGDATLAIIAGLLGMSREKWKKDVTFL